MAEDAVRAAEERKAARKLQELFKGRFSEEESLELLRTHGTLADAADFVLNGDPAEVRKLINDRNQALVDTLRRDSQYVNEALQAGLEKSIRLFACEPCDRYWWRQVPARKEVSKCKVCAVKYDPVPKHEEWGLGEFVCVCGKTFWGSAWMNHTESPCYGCGFTAGPQRILPPTGKKPRQPRTSRSPHSCTGRNCYNRADGGAFHAPHQDDHLPTRSDAWGGSSGRGEQAQQNAPEVPQQQQQQQQQQQEQQHEQQQRTASSHAPHQDDHLPTRSDVWGGSSGRGEQAQQNAPEVPQQQQQQQEQQQEQQQQRAASSRKLPRDEPVCPHEQSEHPGGRVLYPSRPHVSTGSTVDTFMSQGSLTEDYEDVVRMPRVPEAEED